MSFVRRVLLLAAAALAATDATAQTVRHGRLGEPQRAHLEALGPTAAGLQVDVLRGGSVAQKVRGELPLAGDTLQQRCDDFIARHGVLFGAMPAMEFGAPVVLREHAGIARPGGGAGAAGAAETAPREVSLPQLVHGFPLRAHGLWLRFDARGRLVSVHGVLAPGAPQVPAPVVTPAEGEQSALSHLLGLGIAPADLRGEPRTVTAARLVGGAPAIIHAVHVVLRRDLVPLVVEVDAATGAVLAVRRNLSSGTGHFHFLGQDKPFATTTGKGTVYKGIAQALASAEAPGSLPDVAVAGVVTGLANNGTLYGRFAFMLGEADAQTLFAFGSANHDWSVPSDDVTLGDPTSSGQLFDFTNAYSWITRMGRYVQKPFRKPIGSNFSIPVVVNVSDLPNAFYTPDDLGIGTGAGFFAFGDLSSDTTESMDDFSRDPTVVCHEYTHAVCDKAGLVFGDADTDTPPRAVNEAIADFFSAAYNQTPCIGPVFMATLGPDFSVSGDCLRDLSSQRVFPEDLLFETGQTGLPEEHEAGVIFGATLWRVRAALGKSADRLIADSMFDWPADSAEAGFPVVNPGNAEAAYAAYFALCTSAVLDEVQAQKGAAKLAKAFGAVLPNGTLGLDAFDTAPTFVFPGKGKLKWSSEFLGQNAEHALDLQLFAGDSLTVSVTGLLGTPVDFVILVNQMDDLIESQPPTDDGVTVTWKDVLVNHEGTYRLLVSNRSSLGGTYKGSVLVK